MGYTEELLSFEKFEKERKKKFERGRSEHNQEWTMEGVDYINEMKDELLDLYNYASLNPQDRTCAEIMRVAKALWISLDKR